MATKNEHISRVGLTNKLDKKIGSTSSHESPLRTKKNASSSVKSLQQFTIEDSAKMNSEDINILKSLLNESKPITPSINPDKLKRQAKKNHAKLKNLQKDNFEHINSKLNSSATSLSLDASYAQSSNSSNSSIDGVLSGWTFSWSMESDNRFSNKRYTLTPDSNEYKPSIKSIKGGCILRKDSSVVITEPQANRLRVFSRKRGNLLATVDGSEWINKNFTNELNAKKRFFPTGVCETETDNVLAVTDRSKLYYVRISGFESNILEEVNIKGSIDLLGVAYTNQMKMILLDSGHTNRPFIGCYDTSGKIIREFKGNFSKPSYITWNDCYQVAAIVDCGERNISFYNIDAKHLNTFSSSSKQNQLNDLFYPTGISWTSNSQLLVADKANDRILSFDFRSMKSEVMLDGSDGLKEPVVMACDLKGKTLLVTEEELLCGGKDTFRLKTFRRHGVPKAINEGLFF